MNKLFIRKYCIIFLLYRNNIKFGLSGNPRPIVSSPLGPTTRNSQNYSKFWTQISFEQRNWKLTSAFETCKFEKAKTVLMFLRRSALVIHHLWIFKGIQKNWINFKILLALVFFKLPKIGLPKLLTVFNLWLIHFRVYSFCYDWITWDKAFFQSITLQKHSKSSACIINLLESDGIISSFVTIMLYFENWTFLPCMKDPKSGTWLYLQSWRFNWRS
jgi:hypothetical protein